MSRLTAVQDLSDDQVKAELEHFQTHQKFVRPLRSNIDPSRAWKNGLPSYDKSDLAFFRGKTKDHPEGSLESIVENAVKRWEMEATHLNFKDWESIDHESYRVSANGGKCFVGEEAAKVGNYNWLMENTDKALYNAENETFESSHSLFHTAFPGGFPWELLEVFSGPPCVTFTWRHWAFFDGSFDGQEGDNKSYELFGFGVVDLTDELKIKEIQIYYKPDEFLKALHGKVPREALQNGKSLLGSGCPIFQSAHTQA